MGVSTKLLSVLNDAAISFNSNEKHDYDLLLKNIGDARYVLIGEATHGTREFYEIRAEITRQLIIQKGFMAVAIEGDWPSVYGINRYIQGKSKKEEWEQALKDFKRFPTWMWRNEVIPPFIKWLRYYNDQLPSNENKINFYGLDLYSLHSSMQAVINYLEKVDPEAAKMARKRYSCFDHLNIKPEIYGELTTSGVKKSCLKEVISQLLELQHHAYEYIRKDGLNAEDEYFYAVQNARLVKNAEVYYRTMFERKISSWNVRDTHMAETLNAISDHLENHHNKPAKVIIWAHNSHVGDARATEASETGEINIGQLVREQHTSDTYLIGFSTYEGTVTAASNWGGQAECKTMNKGLPSSFEELFHQVKYKNFMLNLFNNKQLEHYLALSRLQRAIGVVYSPETERFSHYYFTCLPKQFDTIIHIDRTNAIQPLAG